MPSRSSSQARAGPASRRVTRWRAWSSTGLTPWPHCWRHRAGTRSPKAISAATSRSRATSWRLSSPPGPSTHGGFRAPTCAVRSAGPANSGLGLRRRCRCGASRGWPAGATRAPVTWPPSDSTTTWANPSTSCGSMRGRLTRVPTSRTEPPPPRLRTCSTVPRKPTLS